MWLALVIRSDVACGTRRRGAHASRRWRASGSAPWRSPARCARSMSSAGGAPCSTCSRRATAPRSRSRWRSRRRSSRSAPFNHYVNVPRYASSGRAVLRRIAGAELRACRRRVRAHRRAHGPAVRRRERARRSPRAAKPLVVTGSDFATTTKVRLTVTPGTDRPEPVRRGRDRLRHGASRWTADRVSLTFSLPGQPDVGSTLALKHQADGSWAAQGTALAIDGRWDVLALIESASGSTQVPLTITPRAPPQQIERLA